jgi:KipI family sensor histidine kinase inhibitor
VRFGPRSEPPGSRSRPPAADLVTQRVQGPARNGPRVEPFGDAAVLITLAGDASVETAARAQTLARHLGVGARGAGRSWPSIVPAACSVLVQIGETPMPTALRVLETLAAELGPADDAWPADAPSVRIPVRYGTDDGPDLLAVAEATGLTPAQVIEAHASARYRVLFLGFAPGFAYMGSLPPELVIPRRPSPRVRVPAGTVAIAGSYTAVYPIDSPGGWHLIGTTERYPWGVGFEPDLVLSPGTTVRFVPERA